MTLDRGEQTTEAESILSRLTRKYLELSDVCYRVSVLAHDGRGRFRKGHRARRPHPALLKKIDLDEALIDIYRRFFDSAYRVSSSSTSKSRCHGRETLTSPRGPSSALASRSE